MSVVPAAARTAASPIADSRRPAGRPGSPTVLLVAAAMLAALFTVLVAPASPAHAAAYRFWGYYQLKDGAWAFAQKGPQELTPKEGSVEGWRFAISGAGTNTRNPRVTPTFKDICGASTAQDGKKRVGVVIDYGRAVDGETGAKPPTPIVKCAVVAKAAHGDEVLASVADVRVENKLVCAVNAYPARGCGGEVKKVPAGATAADKPVPLAAVKPTPTSAPTASAGAAATDSPAPSSNTSTAPESSTQGQAPKSSEDTGVSTGTVVGVIVVIVAVIAVAFVALRRRRQV